MIIWKNWKRGVTIWPFIFMPKWVKGTTQAYCYLEHEMVHYREQAGPLKLLIFGTKYLFSKRCRFEMELRAFKAEIACRVERGLSPKYVEYAKAMSEQYVGMCTAEEALTSLRGNSNAV